MVGAATLTGDEARVGGVSIGETRNAGGSLAGGGGTGNPSLDDVIAALDDVRLARLGVTRSPRDKRSCDAIKILLEAN